MRRKVGAAGYRYGYGIRVIENFLAIARAPSLPPPSCHLKILLKPFPRFLRSLQTFLANGRWTRWKRFDKKIGSNV